MKRFFITAVIVCASALLSCRNITAVTPAEAETVSVLPCSQDTEGECAEQADTAGELDITSPLCIFLLN